MYSDSALLALNYNVHYQGHSVPNYFLMFTNILSCWNLHSCFCSPFHVGLFCYNSNTALQFITDIKFSSSNVSWTCQKCAENVLSFKHFYLITDFIISIASIICKVQRSKRHFSFMAIIISNIHIWQMIHNVRDLLCNCWPHLFHKSLFCKTCWCLLILNMSNKVAEHCTGPENRC